MKLATTPEEQRRWIEQWREAAIVLDEMRRYELMNLSKEDAWRQIEDLQSISDIWRNPHEPCGLIEQQAVFHRRKR